jgi:amidase
LLGAIAAFGMSRLLEEGGVGTNHNGWYWTNLAREALNHLRTRGHELPFTIKRSWLTGTLLREEQGIELYAKAKNIALAAQQAYDEILNEFDALLMPTTPNTAEVRKSGLTRLEREERTHDSAANTAIFSLTHHPALSVPCGTASGLPVGMMLVGAHYDETTLFRLSRAFEAAIDWKSRAF